MQIFIGTSGFQYSHWNNGVFYPRRVKSRLLYVLQKMRAVEINSSFYRIPPPDTVSRWVAELPDEARLVLKAPQSVSHRRRLKLHSDPHIKQGIDLLIYFIEGVRRIPGVHRGPILLQLPRQMEIDLARLEDVLRLFHTHGLPVALEVRHASWLISSTFNLLERYNAVLVASDWPELKTPVTVTTDFVYLRRHGPEALYASSYSDEELLADLDLIRNQPVSFAYVFFNNDIHGYAPHNAMRMLELLALQRTGYTHDLSNEEAGHGEISFGPDHRKTRKDAENGLYGQSERGAYEAACAARNMNTGHNLNYKDRQT